jgi:mannitol-specific phosphotransferase system IIBC component
VIGKEERRQGVRDKISEWTHGPDWKTWIAHGVFGLIIAIVSGIIAALITDENGAVVGAAVAIGYYLIREIEQIVYNIVDKKPLGGKAFDRFMDVAVPAAFVLVLAGIVTVLT